MEMIPSVLIALNPIFVRRLWSVSIRQWMAAEHLLCVVDDGVCAGIHRRRIEDVLLLMMEFV
jgi:hypothetical protein